MTDPDDHERDLAIAIEYWFLTFLVGGALAYGILQGVLGLF